MKATLSLLTKATLSLWLISSLPAFAATEKISALPVTTLLASNDFLVVNIWNGSAFVTKTIAFTNLPIGLNLQNATNLSAFGLDNTNWLRTLIADLPRGTNYGYNLLDPVRSKFRDPTRQFRLLTEGTSLVVGASGSDGIYSSVRFRTLGYRSAAGFGAGLYASQIYPTTFGSGSTVPSQTTNWQGASLQFTLLGDYADLHGLDGFGNITGDTFRIGYKTGPNQGHFAIYTNRNGGAYSVQSADINAFAASDGATFVAWTNAGGPASCSIRLTNITAASTNVFIIFQAEDSTATNGLVYCENATGSTALTNFTKVAMGIRAPMYRLINPDLVLENHLGSDVTDVVAYVDFFKTNTPNARVVYTSPYQNDQGDFLWVPEDLMFLTNCMRQGFSFFDGRIMTWTNIVARGLNADATHLLGPGYQIYSDLLWAWMNLPATALPYALLTASTNLFSGSIEASNTIHSWGSIAGIGFQNQDNAGDFAEWRWKGGDIRMVTLGDAFAHPLLSLHVASASPVRLNSDPAYGTPPQLGDAYPWQIFGINSSFTGVTTNSALLVTNGGVIPLISAQTNTIRLSAPHLLVMASNAWCNCNLTNELSNGDVYDWNSNGIRYAIAKNVAGALKTNQIYAPF